MPTFVTGNYFAYVINTEDIGTGTSATAKSAWNTAGSIDKTDFTLDATRSCELRFRGIGDCNNDMPWVVVKLNGVYHSG